LDDIDNFLTGQHNDEFATEMRELLIETFARLQQIDRIDQPEEFNALKLLFMLQLKLVYNVLGCQNGGRLLKSEPVMILLDAIIEILGVLQKMEVIFPASFKEFLDQYYDRVEEIDLLRAHLDDINNGNLIFFE